MANFFKSEAKGNPGPGVPPSIICDAFSNPYSVHNFEKSLTRTSSIDSPAI